MEKWLAYNGMIELYSATILSSSTLTQGHGPLDLPQYILLAPSLLRHPPVVLHALDLLPHVLLQPIHGLAQLSLNLALNVRDLSELAEGKCLPVGGCVRDIWH